MKDSVSERLKLLRNQLTVTNEMCIQVIQTMELFIQHTEAMMDEIIVMEEGLNEGAPYLND
jgi:hypothetical protein